MKLIRKKRVAIDNFESLKNKKGIIFVSNNFTNYNSRDIKLNKTHIYSKNGFSIDLINNKGKITNITLSNSYGICKDNIINIIDICKGKLYIVILKSGTSIADFNTNTYLDMFKVKGIIHNDIFRYNKSNYSNCY